MRRLLLTLACVLLWASVAQAQITCTADTNFDATGASASATHAITIPGTVSAGDLMVLLTLERDGGSTISSINGTVSGDWPLTATATGGIISSSTGTGGDSRYYWLLSPAGGSDVITVTYSASVTARLAGGWCGVSGTAPVLDEFDATPKTGSSTTPDSDSITPNEGNGITLGGLALGGDQGISDPGSGQTNLTNEALAGHLLSKEATSGVAVNFTTVTLDGSRDWAFHVAAFTQPAAGATCTGGVLLLGAGKCE